MRLIDMLLDSVIDTPLFEMARSRADLKRLALSHSDTLVKHIVKVLVWPDSEAVNVWKTTIRKTVLNMRKAKQVGTHKPLDIKTLRTIWVSGPIGTTDDELVACVVDTIEEILLESDLPPPTTKDYAAVGACLRLGLEKAVAEVHKSVNGA